MGHAIEKSDYVVARRRPSKALRQEYRHTGNLSAYSLFRSDTALASSSVIKPASRTEAPRNKSEFVKLGSQPTDQTAANNESAFTDPESWIGAVPKNQLAIVVVSCLSLGAVVGYHWSSSVNLPHAPIKTMPAVPVDATSAKIDSTIKPIAPLPVEPEAVNTSDNISAGSVQQYLDEIDWLTNQNSTLQLEVDVLNQETLDQNRELLNLELKVATLQSQFEPPTETQVVYNFVNVPIGTAIENEPSDTRLAETQSVNTQNNAPLSDYTTSGGSVAGATVFNSQASNSNLRGDFYSDSSQVADESDELLRKWEIERNNYPIDSEITYDPDTGFYINPNYSYESDEPQYADEEGEIFSYPPIAND